MRYWKQSKETKLKIYAGKKSCYAKYTDKGKISRLRKSLDSSKDTLSPPETATSSALRSKTSSTDWELCIFVNTGQLLKSKHCAQ